MKTLLTLAASLVAISASATVSINYINPVTQVGAFSVRVDGKVTAVSETASFVFEYGTTTAYGSTSQATSVPANQFVQTLFTISTGFVPNTQYHMRIKAVGSVSTTPVYSTDISFTTAAAVAVVQTSPPFINHAAVTSKLVSIGSSAGLDITPDAGSYPFTYQWKLNAKAYGTSSSYQNFSSITAAQAGTWTCTVSNPVPSSATSPSVVITVADITKFPQSTNAAVEGGSISATVTLTPANPAATYLWHTNGNPSGLPSNIGTVSGQGTNKITISNVTPNADSDYVCDVTLGSDTVQLRTGTAHIGLKPTITPIAAQSFQVGEDIGSLQVNLGDATSATVTGLPAGLKYSFANGYITGAPTTPTPLDEPVAIIITAKNAVGTSTLAFPFTVTPLPAGIVGTWVGILDRAGDPTAIGGKVSLNVTATGVVTGSVTNGTLVFPIKASVSSTTGSSTVSLDIPSGILAKTVNLTLNNDGLSGTIGSSGVTGRRIPWNTLNPVAISGVFNCKFTPDSSALSNPAVPHGHSVAALTLGNTGAATAVFHLADNTIVTASTSMGGNGDVPLFVPLYTSTGAVLGTLNIAGRDVSGTLGWNKKPATANVAYKAGFGAQNILCTGKRYVKPNAALGQYFVELPAGASNGHLTFSDGLLSSTATTALTVSLTGVATESNADLTVSLALATGVCSGNLIFRGNDTALNKPVARTAPYYALAIPGTGKAYGYSLSPVFTPSASPTPSLSGTVELAP